MIDKTSLVVKCVNNRPGLTSGELITEVQCALDEAGEPLMTGNNILTFLDGLCRTNKIQELEYTLPTSSEQIKCRYFPIGTVFPSAEKLPKKVSSSKKK